MLLLAGCCRAAMPVTASNRLEVVNDCAGVPSRSLSDVCPAQWRGCAVPTDQCNLDLLRPWSEAPCCVHLLLSKLCLLKL